MIRFHVHHVSDDAKTYASAERAVKAALAVMLNIGADNEDGHVRIIVAAAGNGRFAPMFHLSGDAVQYAAAIARAGFFAFN